MPGVKVAPVLLTLNTVEADSVIAPLVMMKEGLEPSYTNESVLALQLFVPLMIAPTVLLLKVWLLTKVKAELKPETSKVAPPAMVRLLVLMVALPLKASVPVLTFVVPV